MGGVKLEGTGDYAVCVEGLKAQLAALQKEDKARLRMPAELEGRRFLGMSLLYHLTHFLKVGMCTLDPSLKATCFQPLKLRVHTVLST